ncbi:MAG: D-alanine--D-alanine ligase [Oscillospiraceae bacterium]|nr:D-alanine--D-alanine ligase [Oscillospiraceae bacterium]
MKIKLGVFFGGKSVEHEISIISAVQAMYSLDTEKYDIVPVYITKNNEFYTGEMLKDIENYKNLPALLKECQRVLLVNTGKNVELLKFPFKKFGNNTVNFIDVAFPIVHGTNVEDGSLQGYLKTLNLPYVGCDVLSSAVGMDKYVMKTVLKDNNIPVLDCKCYLAKDFDNPDAVMNEIEKEIGYPVIVKPVNLGSSIGISKASDREKLYESLSTAFDYASKVLVETCIENLKEINCSVCGDVDEAEASECEEPVNSDEILSFEEKYMGGGAKDSGSKGMASTKRLIPANITSEQREEIRRLAVKAFQCLGCNGVSRIDFMIDKDTQKIWLNEINTIPGSLSFYLWEPIGTPYTKLLDKMIELAMKRDREEENITYTFDSNVLSGVKLGGGTKGAKGSKM